VGLAGVLLGLGLLVRLAHRGRSVLLLAPLAAPVAAAFADPGSYPGATSTAPGGPS
jgi:hypothetical protein